MMSNLKPLFSLAIVAGISACTASSQQGAVVEAAPNTAAHNHTAVDKHTGHVATVKPGASISINSALPKSMTSGSFQTVQLQFNEAYNSGTMSVSIEPSAGLRLFGGTSSKIFDMATSGAHVWDLDVKADVDGVYFLNVFAEAEGQPRIFSVQLNIGQTTQKMFDEAMPADGELADGGKIRVMDATETIK